MAQPGCLANAYVICQALRLQQHLVRLAGLDAATAFIHLK